MSKVISGIGGLIGGLLGVNNDTPEIPELPAPLDPVVAQAPIEEAGLEIEDEDKKKKKVGKSGFKVPLTGGVSGLSAPASPSASGSVSGLKV